MPAGHALVFFIYLMTQPLPSSSAAGAQMQWVLCGAPSAQEARVWALAQLDKLHLPATPAPKRFLVLPLGDTLYTAEGHAPVDWKALPPPGWFHGNSRSHDTYYFVPTKKLKDKPAQPVSGDDLMPPSEGQPWYYVIYTEHQAVLVQATNPLAAAGPYRKAVAGTPAADEIAGVWPWEGLTPYQPPR